MVYVFRRSDYKFQYFFSKMYKAFNIQFKRSICSSLCQDIILSQKHAIYHEYPKPVTLSFPSSYGYRSVLAKLIIRSNESMTRHKEVVFFNLLPLFLKKDMFRQF